LAEWLSDQRGSDCFTVSFNQASICPGREHQLANPRDRQRIQEAGEQAEQQEQHECRPEVVRHDEDPFILKESVCFALSRRSGMEGQ
jgi:hypothetical protein